MPGAFYEYLADLGELQNLDYETLLLEYHLEGVLLKKSPLR